MKDTVAQRRARERRAAEYMGRPRSLSFRMVKHEHSYEAVQNGRQRCRECPHMPRRPRKLVRVLKNIELKSWGPILNPVPEMTGNFVVHDAEPYDVDAPPSDTVSEAAFDVDVTPRDTSNDPQWQMPKTDDPELRAKQIEGLKSLKRETLTAKCAAKGIKFTTKTTKAQLAELLVDHVPTS